MSWRGQRCTHILTRRTFSMHLSNKSKKIDKQIIIMTDLKKLDFFFFLRDNTWTYVTARKKLQGRKVAECRWDRFQKRTWVGQAFGAGIKKHCLRYLHLLSECLDGVPANVLPIQLPSIAYPGRQQMILQEFGCLSPMFEIWMEFQAPRFDLVQPWLLWAFRGVYQKWKIPLSLFSLVFFSLSNKN